MSIPRLRKLGCIAGAKAHRAFGCRREEMPPSTHRRGEMYNTLTSWSLDFLIDLLPLLSHVSMLFLFNCSLHHHVHVLVYNRPPLPLPSLPQLRSKRLLACRSPCKQIPLTFFPAHLLFSIFSTHTIHKHTRTHLQFTTLAVVLTYTLAYCLAISPNHHIIFCDTPSAPQRLLQPSGYTPSGPPHRVRALASRQYGHLILPTHPPRRPLLHRSTPSLT